MRLSALRLALFVFVTAWVASRLGAQIIPIQNAGFEQDVLEENEILDSSLTPAGWSVYDPGNIIDHDYNDVGVLNPTGTALYGGNGAPEGSNVALIFLWAYENEADYGNPVGLQQELVATLQPFMRYTLTVHVGNIAVNGEEYAPFDLNGFPGYQVQLLAGTTLLAQDDNSLTPAEGEFELSTLEYTTGASVTPGNLVIRLINLNAPNSGIEVNYDDVQLTASAIPEPSTYALLAGLAALGVAIRRRSGGSQG